MVRELLASSLFEGIVEPLASASRCQREQRSMESVVQARHGGTNPFCILKKYLHLQKGFMG